MIISIDFDGTIVQNQFPQIGELLPDAKQSINNLYDSGHKIIINTCRDGQHLIDAINFLLHHHIPFHRVNDNLPENTEKYGSNSRKIYAHRYIDDRNINGFPGWQACITDIENTEAQYLARTEATSRPADNSIIEIEHNIHIDKNNPQAGYLFETISGFFPYTHTPKKCADCGENKSIPTPLIMCPECYLNPKTQTLTARNSPL